MNDQLHPLATLPPGEKPPFSFGNQTARASNPFLDILRGGGNILASAKDLTIPGTSVS